MQFRLFITKPAPQPGGRGFTGFSISILQPLGSGAFFSKIHQLSSVLYQVKIIFSCRAIHLDATVKKHR
jgi:hypothetical protein